MVKLTQLLPQIKIDCDIAAITNDSRQVKAGSCFIAYPGAQADGRHYIDKAIAQGAQAILYECNDGFDLQHPDCVCVAVTNLADKLSGIASRFYGSPSESLTVIGITGTNGKTTIAHMLAQAYSQLGYKTGYIGTLGYGSLDKLTQSANTTPDPILLQHLLAHFVTEGISHVMMEVSSHALVQKRVDAIAFDEAIYTNLSHEHLDYHYDMQSYAEAKSLLFQWPTLKRAVINSDDDWHSLMSEQLNSQCEYSTYAINSRADFNADDIVSSVTGLRFNLHNKDKQLAITSNLIGEFNVYNLLVVAAMLRALAISDNKLQQVLAALQPIPGRMDLIHQVPAVLIDYSHTPDALENALLSLKAIKKGRLICVFGCGGDRDKAKRPQMGKIAVSHADIVIITSDNPRSEDPVKIINDITNGVDDPSCYHCEADRERAIELALKQAGTEDIVIIAGKGHENYQIIKSQKNYFSDAQTALKYLNYDLQS